jgi:AcrR family transcriptional regulator
MEPAAARKPGRPRDPDLEARRKAEILDAAAGVFAAAGYASADVQVIADRIGVGKGTVYRYFPTKEALFLAAVERGLAELTAEIDRIVGDPGLDPLDQVSAAVLAYLQFFQRRPEMAELFIQERAAFRDRHVPLYFANEDAGACAERRALFEKLVAAGRVRPMPEGRFFGVIGDLLYGTILTNLLTGRPADPADQAQDVLDVVFHGILTDAERKRSKKAGEGKA